MKKIFLIFSTILLMGVLTLPGFTVGASLEEFDYRLSIPFSLIRAYDQDYTYYSNIGYLLGDTRIELDTYSNDSMYTERETVLYIGGNFTPNIDYLTNLRGEVTTVEYYAFEFLLTYEDLENDFFVEFYDMDIESVFVRVTPQELDASTATYYPIDGILNLKEILNSAYFDWQNYYGIDIMCISELLISVDFVQPVQDVDFRLNDFPVYTLTEYSNIFSRYNRTTITYELNFFESIMDSVSAFFDTEFIPGVSFTTLLVLALAIPLTVWLLKAWLGG